MACCLSVLLILKLLLWMQEALTEGSMSRPVGVNWTGQSIAAKLTGILLEVVGATISETEPLMEVTAPSPSRVLSYPCCVPILAVEGFPRKHYERGASNLPPAHTRCILARVVQAGLDSLGAVELRNAISAAFAVDIAATVAFDYPTVAALATYISSKVCEATWCHRGSPEILRSST